MGSPNNAPDWKIEQRLAFQKMREENTLNEIEQEELDEENLAKLHKWEIKYSKLKRTIKILNIVSIILLILFTVSAFSLVIGYSIAYNEIQDGIIIEEAKDIELQRGNYWASIYYLDESNYIEFTVVKKSIGYLFIYLANPDNVTFEDTHVYIWEDVNQTSLSTFNIRNAKFIPPYEGAWLFIVRNSWINNNSIVFDISYEISSDEADKFANRLEIFKTSRNYVMAPLLGFISFLYAYERIYNLIEKYRKKREQKNE